MITDYQQSIFKWYNSDIVHQAAKLVAALLRVAGVTAGLAESNGSLYRRVYDSDLPTKRI